MAVSNMSNARDASLLSDHELAAISGGGFEDDVAAYARRIVALSVSATGVDVSGDWADCRAELPDGT